MRDVTLLSMTNKSVQNCRIVHHSNFIVHCRISLQCDNVKFKFEGGGGLEKSQYAKRKTIFKDK